MNQSVKPWSRPSVCNDDMPIDHIPFERKLQPTRTSIKYVLLEWSFHCEAVWLYVLITHCLTVGCRLHVRLLITYCLNVSCRLHVRLLITYCLNVSCRLHVRLLITYGTVWTSVSSWHHTHTSINYILLECTFRRFRLPRPLRPRKTQNYDETQ